MPLSPRGAIATELRQQGWAERLMAGAWERAGTIVRRQEPIVTRGGKILPFHVATS